MTANEMAAGRIRPLPVPLLMQQMIGPVLLYFMTRPAAGQVPGLDPPDTQEACAVFAEAFLRAVTMP
ncbi:hypothetical protein [Nonomuraea sp. NPDC049480]|uniref:hypothetical protein n=1 Tax=Nonomuraea sp. NPDC049480 TaxID=3364353 RepID=UPI0037A11909